MAKTETPASAESSMHLAEILSDLVSLRVCEPSAALALVSTRSKSTTEQSQHPSKEQGAEQDPDLQRAKDLVELHYSVREAHKRGELGKGLNEAREAVKRAVGG